MRNSSNTMAASAVAPNKQCANGGDTHQRLNGEITAAFHQPQRLGGQWIQPYQRGGDKGQLPNGLVKLLQSPAYCHHNDQRNKRQVLFQAGLGVASRESSLRKV
ncbi:Uncharacterised protein [Salmonella bongori]|nr:Uncharacterised protein [Salmonella bongori]